MTTLGNITSWDNVMIKFPVRWIKMSKSWSTVTLSITEELDKDGYQYYAHSTGTLSNPWTPKDAFYLWAYKWYNNSNVLKSWSWKTPSYFTQPNACTYAKANGSWYNIIGFYQKMYITALYMMKYWNPNWQTTVWKWYIWWSNITNTWWVDSQVNATYGTSSATTQMKLFGLEDWWGNIREWIWGACTDSSQNLRVALSWYSWTISTSSPYSQTWDIIQNSWNYFCLSSIVWNNKTMFWPSATISNTNYNTYYCNFSRVMASRLMATQSRYDTSFPTAFSTNFLWTETSSDWARLMFL
jgi:hypothetical protein